MPIPSAGLSQRKNLLEDMARSAMAYAASIGATVDNFANVVLPPGLTLIDDLSNSIQSRWQNATPELFHNFWPHSPNPFEVVKSGVVPSVDKDWAESVINEYLALPYRSQSFDRLSVDVLIGSELYMFADEQFGPRAKALRYWFFPSANLLSPHPLVVYLFVLLLETAVLLGLGAIVAVGLERFVGEDVAFFIASGLAIVWLISIVWLTIRLPFFWRSFSFSRRRTRTLLSHMLAACRELGGKAVSAIRVRELAVKASDEGAGWPSILFVVLDDNIARGGRL